jgi:sulfur carrier protein
MEVFINQISTCFEEGTTLSQALQSSEARPPFAVAINLQFISRQAYDTTILKAGDKIEIVHPITGG